MIKSDTSLIDTTKNDMIETDSIIKDMIETEKQNMTILISAKNIHLSNIVNDEMVDFLIYDVVENVHGHLWMKYGK
jgi:hypothetical protein